MTDLTVDVGVNRRALPVVPGRVIYRAAKVRGSSYRVPAKKKPKT